MPAVDRRQSVLPLFSAIVYCSRFFPEWGPLAIVLAGILLPLAGRRQYPLGNSLRLHRQGWALITLILAALILAVCFLPTTIPGLAHRQILLQTEPGELIELVILSFPILFPLAFAEEFFFRGYLQETIGRALWRDRGRGPFTFKNLFAVIFFVLIHCLTRDPADLALIGLGGLLFGWIVERSRRSIWPAAVLHTCINVGYNVLNY